MSRLASRHLYGSRRSIPPISMVIIHTELHNVSTYIDVNSHARLQSFLARTVPLGRHDNPPKNCLRALIFEAALGQAYSKNFNKDY